VINKRLSGLHTQSIAKFREKNLCKIHSIHPLIKVRSLSLSFFAQLHPFASNQPTRRRRRTHGFIVSHFFHLFTIPQFSRNEFFSPFGETRRRRKGDSL
jgi:hypothetical protein